MITASVTSLSTPVTRRRSRADTSGMRVNRSRSALSPIHMNGSDATSTETCVPSACSRSISCVRGPGPGPGSCVAMRRRAGSMSPDDANSKIWRPTSSAAVSKPRRVAVAWSASTIRPWTWTSELTAEPGAGTPGGSSRSGWSNRYPLLRTVRSMRGWAGSSSILPRRRRTWSATVVGPARRSVRHTDRRSSALLNVWPGRAARYARRSNSLVVRSSRRSSTMRASRAWRSTTTVPMCRRVSSAGSPSLLTARTRAASCRNKNGFTTYSSAPR